jgi:hypothetical protein
MRTVLTAVAGFVYKLVDDLLRRCNVRNVPERGIFGSVNATLAGAPYNIDGELRATAANRDATLAPLAIRVGVQLLQLIGVDTNVGSPGCNQTIAGATPSRGKQRA